MERHYGMDWLRIGAFAVLIFYHIGMVFVPWAYHVKAAPTADWATVPMLLPSAWRLSLLFVVSGFASRMLLVKQSSLAGFARNRSARLLLPLVFGMAVIVPPQLWVELVSQHGYTRDFAWFWLHDYFRFEKIRGLDAPTWNHLWFVVYLWVYTLAVTLLALAVRGTWLQRAFDRAFAGWTVLALPLAWLLIVHLWLAYQVPETHDLVNDPAAHLVYLPAFLFGFGLAGSRTVFAAIGRWWRLAAAGAVLSYLVAAGIQLWWLHVEAPLAVKNLFYVARAVQGWTSIVALIGIADRYWNRDHRLRPMLTEAVFPFYLVHQTIIVVAAWWLLRLPLPGVAEFMLLVLATVAGCWLFYRLGREIAPLRPLIGLRTRRSREREDANIDPGSAADVDARERAGAGG